MSALQANGFHTAENGLRLRKAAIISPAPASPPIDEDIAKVSFGGCAPAPSTDEKFDPVAKSQNLDDDLSVPEEHAHRSELAQLWLLSRVISRDPVKYRNQGEDRPVSVRNIRLAFRIAKLIWRDVLLLYFGNHSRSMALYTAGRFIQGSLPACRIWASSAMLDIVQRSFEAPVPKSEVFQTAAANLLLHASEDIFRYLFQANEADVRAHVEYTFVKAHLRTQLSLSIPALSSPYTCALVHESGIVAGMENRVTKNGGMMRSSPANNLDAGILQLPTIFTQIASQLFLLLNTIRCGGATLSSWSSILLILFSLAPSLLRIIASWLGATGNHRARRMGMRTHMNRNRMVRDLGTDRTYKQEIVLFGLRDWIMEKWEGIMQGRRTALAEQRFHMGFTQLGLHMGQEVVQTGFHVLLALRILSTGLSLGSIRLYQSATRTLLESIIHVGDVLGEVYQSAFYLAAYIEAMDIPEHPEKLLDDPSRFGRLIDYETTRLGDGMAIEARDMGFSYPGTSKPTLRNINLSLPAGQTLAIVGFNGGGKTTLVKALMGLYDHTGDLTINKVDSKLIDPDTLHKRTSCLFQDFSKYSLTLRENVGVGNVEYMTNDEKITRSLDRGDARKILDKVGLEGELNKWAVPKPAEEETSISAKPPLQPGVKQIEAPKTPTLNEKTPNGIVANGTATPPTPATPTSTPNVLLSKMTKVLGFRGTDAGSETWLQDPKDKANSLSGGQWQRVALARAFLRADEADLVVFDEPSASLDPKAEAELFQRIHGLSHQNGRKTTTIYISHRFSTVRKADRIAVVEDGTIVEQGSHAELIALKGRYHELYNLQREGFVDD